MRATVKLIEGLHITAADKRNILDGIEYLRETFARFVEASPETVPNYAIQWVKRKGSKKSYSIAPCPNTPNNYQVTMRETYTNDYGARRQHDSWATVELRGVAPLHLPAWQPVDLFPNEASA